MAKLSPNSAANSTRGGKRPSLLFLCQTLPYPPDSGVHVRSYNILRLLSTEYDIRGLFFYRRRTRPTEQAVREALTGLGSVATAEAFAIPQEHSRVRLLWDHGRSVIKRRAYTVFAYDSRAFRQRLLQRLRQESFDVIHVDSLDLSVYLPLLIDAAPVACTHHNVESELLRRRAAVARNPAVRGYLRSQAYLIAQEEERSCGRFDLNVAVSPNDLELLKQRAPTGRFTLVPNGVDTTYFKPLDSGRDGLVFVGGYEWFPNRDGMEFFVRDILPKIRRQDSNVEVTWVGRADNGVVEEYRKQGVRMTGHVADIRPFVHSAGCYIAPIRVGGGTRLKILDAWALGKAVVSTSVGCEGLEAEDGRNILIRDDPTDFANAVNDVLADDMLRSSLGNNGRLTAVRRYDWKVIGEKLLNEYRALNKTRGGHW